MSPRGVGGGWSRRIRRRNAEELRALRGASPIEVISKMNPIIITPEANAKVLGVLVGVVRRC